MARHRTFRKVPKGQAKPLYPKGWPGNMRAVLYFNSVAYKARKEED